MATTQGQALEAARYIWMDGQQVPWRDANVHIMTHSLHYGLGAFEGIRAYKRANGKTSVFRLREHIDRLFDTCKMTLLQPKFTREQVMQLLDKLAELEKQQKALEAALRAKRRAAAKRDW